MKLRIPALALIPGLAIGCYSDSQTQFTSGRSLVSCDSSVPVCTTMAGCVLDGTNYVQGSFDQGATVEFIVQTTGPATIDVQVFFSNEQSPGTDTEVTWYEVGCFENATSSSDGTDVFAEAGAASVWDRSHQVTTAGDHLVEVFSDAQADYLIRVNVLEGQ